MIKGTLKVWWNQFLWVTMVTVLGSVFYAVDALWKGFLVFGIVNAVILYGSYLWYKSDKHAYNYPRAKA